jgi:hypothetical protein
MYANGSHAKIHYEKKDIEYKEIIVETGEPQ